MDADYIYDEYVAQLGFVDELVVGLGDPEPPVPELKNANNPFNIFGVPDDLYKYPLNFTIDTEPPTEYNNITHGAITLDHVDNISSPLVEVVSSGGASSNEDIKSILNSIILF